MTLVEMNWQPTHRQLRQFGATCAIALPLLMWLSRCSPAAILEGGLAGCAIALATWFRPGIARPVFIGLSLLSLPIGIVVSELALLGVFVGIIVPTGLTFRLRKRDALQRKIEQDAVTYWSAKRETQGVSSYFRQW